MYFDTADETPITRELYLDNALQTNKVAELEGSNLPVIIHFNNNEMVELDSGYYYPLKAVDNNNYYSVKSEGNKVYAELHNSTTGNLYTIANNTAIDLEIDLIGI